MNSFSAKSAAACLFLSLLAAPAMANSFFSDIATFGQELWQETKKLAPGIQYDKRNETAPAVNIALDDGRDYPALERPESGAAISQVGHNRAGVQQSVNQAADSNNNVQVAEAPAMQPASVASNHGWQFEEQDNLK